MAYYGNQPTVGQNQSFKVLDDISSYTETFDATSTAVVSASNNTLTFYDHRFVQGQRVTYTHGGGAVINGLATATAYYIIRQDKDTIQLAINATNAANGTAIGLSLSGTSGTAHTLNIAFDGTNTKFKATYQTGYHVKLTRAAQLQIAINGVVQEPVDSTSPSNGFGIDSNNVIVFSAAPVSTDDFWGTFLASNLPSWEISDNKVDNFDGNSTATNFTLSKLPANNENVLVTVNGVVQHPSDATTTRAYKLIGQEIVFTDAPLTGEAIQVRHIGFAGAAAGGVTGFYGRTGNVTLTSADDVTINNITGVAATFTGNVSIGGTLTYTDVTNIDAVGIITAQQGIHIGAGATAGAIDVTTGIATFSSVGIADSIYHIGDGDTSLKFGTDTVTAETAGTERLRIDSSGRVSIGNNPTIDTNTNLHIEEASGECGVVIEGNNGGAGAYLLLRNNSTSSNPRSYVGGVDAGGQGTSQIEFHNLDNANNEGELTLHTRPSGGSMTERLSINSAGVSTFYGDVTLEAGGANRISMRHTGGGNAVIKNPTAANLSFGTNNNDNELTIKNGGKVGIGSTQPTYALEVNGGTQNTVIALRSTDARAGISFLDNTSGGYGRATIGGEGDQVYITSGNGAEKIRFGTGGSSNTIGISTTLNLVTNSEVLSVRGYSSFKSTSANYAAIYTHNEGDTDGTYNAHLLWNAGGANRGGIGYMPNTGELTLNHQYAMTFRTGGSQFSGTERLRISSTGMIGINTTVPTAYLSFNAQRSTQTMPPICFQTSYGAGLADAAISTTDDSGGTDIMMGSNVYMGQNGAFVRYMSGYGSAAVRCQYTGKTLFYNKSGNNAPVESMRIDGDGKVGINSTSPTTHLDVLGHVAFGIPYIAGAGTGLNAAGICTVRGHRVNAGGSFAELYLANSKSAGGTNIPTCSLRAERDESNDLTRLAFYTNETASGGNGTEKMVIGADGTVRIKRPNISNAIQTIGNNSNYLEIGSTEGSSSYYQLVTFGYRADDTKAKPAFMGYQGQSWAADTYGDLVFGTRNTTDGADEPKEKMRIPTGGGLILSNWGANRGIIFQSTAAQLSGNSMANIQGSGGRGITETKFDIADNTATSLCKSHWGGLALIGYAGTGHQGYRLVSFGYGGAGTTVLDSGQWVGGLTTTFSMSTYELQVTHNAGIDLSFWCILIGV